MFTKVIFVASIVLVAEPLSSECIDCICQQESGCEPIGCKMDRGSLSCGYFQITLPYYKDCGKPEKKRFESTKTAWKRCSDDYNCARTCVQNYFNKTMRACDKSGRGECESFTRLHSGGPLGCTARSTDDYWNKVRSCCDCS